MHKVYCDICGEDMTKQTFYGIKVFEFDSRGQDATSVIKLELCQPCQRVAVDAIDYWRKNGIITKYS